jgi:hypothetical protein
VDPGYPRRGRRAGSAHDTDEEGVFGTDSRLDARGPAQ